MIVQKLEIEEFRGIKESKGFIELSNFSILIGRNNSGKSTILEALSLLPTPNWKDYITDKGKIQQLVSLHRSKPIKNKALLYRYAGVSRINNRVGRYRLEIKIMENDHQLYVNGKSDWNDQLLSRIFQVEPNPEALRKTVIFIPNDTMFLQAFDKKMESLKERITKQGIHVSIAEALNKCIDDEYSDITFLEPLSIRKVFSDGSLYLQLRDLGAGAEKAVKLMTLIEAIKPKLLLIDDFGAGFHPSLIGVVLEWLKNKEWQTIIATHNIDVLSKLLDVEIKDTKVIQLKKSKEDILGYQYLTISDLEDLFNSNTDPRLLVDILDL